MISRYRVLFKWKNLYHLVTFQSKKTQCLAVGCHLTVGSGSFSSVFAGVHLLWRVQTVKLMKMLQNQ